MTERGQGSGSLRWIVITLVLASLLLGGLALLVVRPGAGEAPGADGIYTGYLAPPILERIVSGSDGVP